MLGSMMWMAGLVSSVAVAAPGTNKGLEQVCERVFDAWAPEEHLAAAADRVTPEQVCATEIAFSRGKCDLAATTLSGSLGGFLALTPVDASATEIGAPMPVFVISVFDTTALTRSRYLSWKANNDVLAGRWAMVPGEPFTLLGEAVPPAKEGAPWTLVITAPGGETSRVEVAAVKVDPAASLVPAMTTRTTEKGGQVTTTYDVTVMAKGKTPWSGTALLHELRGLALEVTFD